MFSELYTMSKTNENIKTCSVIITNTPYYLTELIEKQAHINNNTISSTPTICNRMQKLFIKTRKHI